MQRRLILAGLFVFIGTAIWSCSGGETPTAPNVPPPPAAAVTGATTGSEAKMPKVDVCHLTGNGSYKKLNVNGNALPAHLGHGDAQPNDQVPGQDGKVFNDACEAATISVDIEKSTNGADADEAPGPSLRVDLGAQAQWTYVVTNDGEVPLRDLEIVDDQGVALTCVPDVAVAGFTLGVGGSVTCTASAAAEAGPYANVGSVSAKSLGTNFASAADADASHYFGEDPGIDIEKATNGEDADTPPGPSLAVGEAVSWTYEVTNTGNVVLTDVGVSDDQGVAVSCPATELAVGASMTCTAEGVAVEGQYGNVGSAEGTPPSGAPAVTDADPSHYEGEAPAGGNLPVARNDWIQPGCSLSGGGGSFTCTYNAPVGKLFANNPGTTASGPSGADSDPDGNPFTAQIAGLNVVGNTGDPWSPPGPQVRTCTGDFLCTTDSNFIPGSSSLTINGDGSFTLTYTTSVNPFGSLIAEFLYVIVDVDGTSSPALVEVIIN